MWEEKREGDCGREVGRLGGEGREREERGERSKVGRMFMGVGG